jgi:hypothetical protein
MDGSLHPIIAGAGALLCLGLFSAAAILIEEEEEQSRALSVITEVVPPLVVQLRKRWHTNNLHIEPVKRRLVFWDRDRAYACIQSDYLGPTPSFSLDDFKRIF